MNILKVARDYVAKAMLGTSVMPAGLVELNRYIRIHGPITFAFHDEDGTTIAVSNDFRYGSIIAQGTTKEELDANIKDAILTSFDISSAYAKEAGIRQVGEAAHGYAPA